MEALWSKIKSDVDKHHWVDEWSLNENVFLTKLRASEMVSGNKFCTLARHGDLIAGFYLDQNATASRKLSLKIGGVEIRQELIVHPGEFVYFFKNTVFPILAIAFSETHLEAESYDDLWVIYAIIIDTKIRREIAGGTHIANSNKEDCAIIRGHFGYVEDVDKYIEQNPNPGGIYIGIKSIFML